MLVVSKEIVHTFVLEVAKALVVVAVAVTIIKVINFNFENKALRRRLLDMGITKGVEIEIVKISPLHDPFNIRLRGYELCIRKDELENIECEVIK